MVDGPRSGIYIRDGETSVPQAGTEGPMSEVRHYVMRAETGILTGLLFGERDDNRVQGETNEQGSDQTNSGQEGQS